MGGERLIIVAAIGPGKVGPFTLPYKREAGGGVPSVVKGLITKVADWSDVSVPAMRKAHGPPPAEYPFRLIGRRHAHIRHASHDAGINAGILMAA